MPPVPEESGSDVNRFEVPVYPPRPEANAVVLMLKSRIVISIILKFARVNRTLSSPCKPELVLELVERREGGAKEKVDVNISILRLRSVQACSMFEIGSVRKFFNLSPSLSPSEYQNLFQFE